MWQVHKRHGHSSWEAMRGSSCLALRWAVIHLAYNSGPKDLSVQFGVKVTDLSLTPPPCASLPISPQLALFSRHTYTYRTFHRSRQGRPFPLAHSTPWLIQLRLEDDRCREWNRVLPWLANINSGCSKALEQLKSILVKVRVSLLDLCRLVIENSILATEEGSGAQLSNHNGWEWSECCFVIFAWNCTILYSCRFGRKE